MALTSTQRKHLEGRLSTLMKPPGRGSEGGVAR